MHIYLVLWNCYFLTMCIFVILLHIYVSLIYIYVSLIYICEFPCEFYVNDTWDVSFWCKVNIYFKYLLAASLAYLGHYLTLCTMHCCTDTFLVLTYSISSSTGDTDFPFLSLQIMLKGLACLHFLGHSVGFSLQEVLTAQVLSLGMHIFSFGITLPFRVSGCHCIPASSELPFSHIANNWDDYHY